MKLVLQVVGPVTITVLVDRFGVLQRGTVGATFGTMVPAWMTYLLPAVHVIAVPGNTSVCHGSAIRAQRRAAQDISSERGLI